MFITAVCVISNRSLIVAAALLQSRQISKGNRTDWNAIKDFHQIRVMFEIFLKIARAFRRV